MLQAERYLLIRAGAWQLDIVRPQWQQTAEACMEIGYDRKATSELDCKHGWMQMQELVLTVVFYMCSVWCIANMWWFLGRGALIRRIQCFIHICTGSEHIARLHWHCQADPPM